MSADAMYLVTKALQARLETVAGAGKVFVGQLDDPDVGNSTLILFLYRIAPNASLRNREHRVATTAVTAPVAVFANALPLDLHYLLTVGTMPGASEELLLKTLGAAMQLLQSDPALTGAGVEHETVHLSLDPLSTEETSRIWALFPTANYRTSVGYLATPVWIDPKLPEPGAPLVVSDRLDAGVRATLAP